MVSPVRCSKKVTDMEDGELSHLSHMTVMTHRLLCQVYGVTDCDVALQDGPDAGQTIEVQFVYSLQILSDFHPSGQKLHFLKK